MEKHQEISSCFLCLQHADFLCECCEIPYCSKEHYKIHRDASSATCRPFRILYKPEVGRYVVATRDIEPLELILVDTPAIYGPNHDSVPACMECLLPVDGNYLCESCSLPLCGPGCENGENHAIECSVFSQPLPTGFKFRVDCAREAGESGAKPIAPEYGCITPLRGLLLREQKPEVWKRLEYLMDHDSDRKKETEFQKMFQVNVVDFLTKVCGFDYQEEEIFRIIGILRTNALLVEDPEMKANGVSGRVVYPTFSYLSHSCICNARYSMEPKNHKITVRAQVRIPAGEEITIQYLSFMFGHLKRKADIRDYWFFDCSCQRCRDPTELGSYMSAMKCSDCLKGDLLPVNPMDIRDEDWQCSQCQHRQSSSSVQDYIDSCEAILYDTMEHDVKKYEKMLDEFRTRLHPRHYIVMTVKKYLADLYGCTEGYHYNTLSEERLLKKIQFYSEFLETVGSVDPGFTKWRGSVLFERHKPMMVKVNKDLSTGQISKEDFVKTLVTIRDHLEEAVKCLEPEFDGTKEAYQCKMAQKALVNIKEIIHFSDFL